MSAPELALGRGEFAAPEMEEGLFDGEKEPLMEEDIESIEPLRSINCGTS